MTWPVAWRQSRADTPTIEDRENMTVFKRVYVVPRGAIETRPERGDLLPGESGLTGERVMACGAPSPSASRNQYRVTVTSYVLVGEATRYSGDTDNLILLKRTPVEADGGGRAMQYVYAATHDTEPPALGTESPDDEDFELSRVEVAPYAWPGHDRLTMTFTVAFDLGLDGFVRRELHRVYVAAGDLETALTTTYAEGTLWAGDDTLTGRRVASVAVGPGDGGVRQLRVTTYKIVGEATRLSGDTDDLIELKPGPARRDAFERNVRSDLYASVSGSTPGMVALGETDGDYLVVAVDTSERHWPGHDLITVSKLDARPKVSTDGSVRYEVVTEAVASGGTLPEPGDKYAGDTDLTGRYAQRVEFATPAPGGQTLCGVTYYRILGESDGAYLTLNQSPISGEGTDQRVFDVVLACLPTADSPVYGTAYADDTVADIHQATLLHTTRRPLRWPAHDQIEVRYIGSRSNGTSGELRSSYRRKRIGRKAWRSRRRFEILLANLATTENTLYDAVDPYLTGQGDYTPRCYATEAASEARPGVMELVALYETPRNENYARVSVRGSKRTEPLTRDLDDKVLDGPIEEDGQVGFWRIVSGHTSRPKGVAVIMVHTASSDVVDLSDLVASKMWHVNSGAMTSLGPDFGAGTMLLLGPEMTRYWRRGALWYIDYAFLYEPEGHNDLTKRQAFCEYVTREPELIWSGAGFERVSEDEEEWATVTREGAGYLEYDAEGGLSRVASSPESTRVFPSADFSELNGKITWDE